MARKSFDLIEACSAPVPVVGKYTHRRPVRTFVFTSAAEQLVCMPWVSSDLRTISGPLGLQWRWARDLHQVDADKPRVYRKLDLAWYGWLGRRMETIRTRAAAGEFSPQAWETTRARFAAVWQQARTQWSADALAQAIEWASDTYNPPRLRTA